MNNILRKKLEQKFHPTSSGKMITSYFSPKNSSNSSRKKVSEPSSQAEQNANKRVKTTHDVDSHAIAPPQSKLTTSSTFFIPEVVELLSNLDKHETCNNDNETNDFESGESKDIMNTWYQALLPKLQRNSFWFQNLAKFVARERSQHTIYPPPEDTFSCLNLTPLSKLKVVIVGQDPYHGPNQGHGLCFSVRKGIMIPPSLRNIYKELLNDGRVSFGSKMNNQTNNDQGRPRKPPTHGFLEHWATQGVLLLNTVLTVRRGQANSHAKKGWEQFTDYIIQILDHEYTKPDKKGLVFLLWGKPASKKAARILGKKQHAVICTSHPSPLGASKTNSPFLGSKCFSKANDALIERGHEPIDWNVD